MLAQLLADCHCRSGWSAHIENRKLEWNHFTLNIYQVFHVYSHKTAIWGSEYNGWLLDTLYWYIVQVAISHWPLMRRWKVFTRTLEHSQATTLLGMAMMTQADWSLFMSVTYVLEEGDWGAFSLAGVKLCALFADFSRPVLLLRPNKTKRKKKMLILQRLDWVK